MAAGQATDCLLTGTYPDYFKVDWRLSGDNTIFTDLNIS